MTIFSANAEGRRTPVSAASFLATSSSKRPRSRVVLPAAPSPPSTAPVFREEDTGEELGGGQQAPLRTSMSISPPPTPQPKQQPLPPLYDDIMALEKENQWMFTDDEIISTPSGLDGIASLEERSRRAKGVNFILSAGILLKLPQPTLATASVFFHRFFMRQSMVVEKNGIHHYNIAATALFLATKTEENCRKTKEIVIAVAKVAQKNASLIIDEQSKEYWRWRDNILLYEELLLEVLTFDMMLQSPYKYLHHFLQDLQSSKSTRNTAWAFLNDSCLTTLCLQMPAKDIAVAAVYFATKFTRERLMDDEDGNPWWDRLGGSPDRIVKAVEVMNQFWLENPLRRAENPYDQSQQSPSNGVGDLERTRNRREDANNTLKAPNPEQSEHRERQLVAQQVEELYNRERARPSTAANGQTVMPTTEVDDDQPPAPKSATVEPQPDLDDSQDVPGSSDALLKRAANDPATHEHATTEPDHATNGEGEGEVDDDAATTATHVRRASSKRKELNDDEDDGEDDNDHRGERNGANRQPASKRPRTEEIEEEEEEEGEEGELEE